MSISLPSFKDRPILWLYVGGVLLLLVGAWLWWAKICTDPERVFWSTISQSLSSQGVTIRAEQTGDGATVHQTVQYSLGASNLSHSRTTLIQQGTTVTNEVIGTPKVDYTRYITIKTDQKKVDGGAIDFSEIVGVWAKSKEGTNQLFPEAILGTALPLGGVGVPIANLDRDDRERLLRQIRSDAVYYVDFKKVKKQRKNHRLLHIYDVSIQPVAYAALMKQFARTVGLEGLEKLDPNAYKGQKPLTLQLTVDVRARQIVQASVPDLGYKQIYSSYDVPVMIDLPKQTISASELQNRLSKLQ